MLFLSLVLLHTYLILLEQDLEREKGEKESLVSELANLKSILCEQETDSSKALSELKDEKKRTETMLTGQMNAHKVSPNEDVALPLSKIDY